MRSRSACTSLVFVAACVTDPGSVGAFGEGTSSGGETTPGTVSTISTGSASNDTTGPGDPTDAESSTSTGFVFDVNPTGGEVDLCAVQEIDAAPPSCDRTAPPETFEAPTVEWTFDGKMDGRPEAFQWSEVIPLVANLTDDNSDGTIDLCDIPDVVLVAGSTNPDLEGTSLSTCRAYILDGASGAEHLSIEGVDCRITPALGDIDGDGVAEIVVGKTLVDDNPFPTGAGSHTLAAYDPDGSELWAHEGEFRTMQFGGHSSTLAIHDLDGDGSPEILAEGMVFDAEGHRVWKSEHLLQVNGIEHMVLGAPTAVDVDADGELEVLNAAGVFDLRPNGDGTWTETGAMLLPLAPNIAFPTVADFFPGIAGAEIVFSRSQGLILMMADGTFPWGPDPVLVAGAGCDEPNEGAGFSYLRPAAVHDFDEDGRPELLAPMCDQLAVVEINATGPALAFNVTIDDASGAAAASGFDFLADGFPELVYGDEHTAWVFSGEGDGFVEAMALPREHETVIEFPVVADVDNDGSAELLVVSSDDGVPALTVFGTAKNDFVQARRIWNQHAYYVTNVLEDGTIPRDVIPNHTLFNTFRVNSVIEESSICVPAG